MTDTYCRLPYERRHWLRHIYLRAVEPTFSWQLPDLGLHHDELSLLADVPLCALERQLGH